VKKKDPGKGRADESRAINDVEYEVARLKHWAGLLGRGIHLTPRQSRELANYLQELAAMPTTLAAIVAARAPGAGRPSMRATAERHYYVALDYYLTRFARGALAKSWMDTAEAWKIGRTAVTDAQKLEKDEHWRWWALTVIAQFRRDHYYLERRALRPALVASIRPRGNIPVDRALAVAEWEGWPPSCAFALPSD
jgi:hypothetical protein